MEAFSVPTPPTVVSATELVPKNTSQAIMALFGASKPANNPLADKDIEVVEPPNDSITRVAFSPAADILAVASWNGEVSYSVGPIRHPLILIVRTV